MTKTIKYTLLTLILLTLTTALISNYIDLKVGVFFVLILSALKFILVSFQFMELKKANPFWKWLIISFLVIFTTIILTII